VSTIIKNRDTYVSEFTAATIRRIRKDRGWSMLRLSNELHDHRDELHPEGFEMSPAVIYTMEHGVSAQHGYGPRKRSVSVDELVAFAEVFGVKIGDLLP